jgi:hypothetical protein
MCVKDVCESRIAGKTCDVRESLDWFRKFGLPPDFTLQPRYLRLIHARRPRDSQKPEGRVRLSERAGLLAFAAGTTPDRMETEYVPTTTR